MNPAITAALIAAAHEEEIEKEVVGKLREARATGPSSAIPLAGAKREHLDEAMADGSVKETSDGRFYLDERAIADRKEGQGFLALLIIAVIFLIVASGVALVLAVRH